MDMAREREWYGARRGAVESSGPMREQDPECVLGGRRKPERLVEVIVLRIIGTPVSRVIDPHERERRAAALDHMHAVLHEHLPCILHTADNRVPTRVAVGIAEDRDDAQG